MIKVLFFAKLSELLDCKELFIEADNAKDTKQLFEYLLSLNPAWQTVLNSQPWLKAVNQTMQSGDVNLKDGDEVAFFPPVTGG